MNFDDKLDQAARQLATEIAPERDLWPGIAERIGAGHRAPTSRGSWRSLLVAAASPAHEMRPALLEVTEEPGGVVQMVWKVPTRGNRRLARTPRSSGRFATLSDPWWASAI